MTLLYHKSNINNNNKYHKLCDNTKNILLLIKSNYNKLFDGYALSFIYPLKNNLKY